MKKILALALLATGAALSVGAAEPAGASGPAKVLLPSAASPLVAVRVVFRTGSIDDPAGKEGLAALTATIMAEGATRTRTYPEVIDALYPIAGDIGVQVGKEMTTFFGTIHRDNLARYAAILEGSILRPKFADDDFQRHRQDASDEISKSLRGNDDEELGKESLNVMLYGGTPYGHPQAGTVEGLKAISVEDVKSFYRTHFTRDRLTVGLAGGYPAPFAEAFAAAFDALPASGAPAAELRPQAPLEKTSVLIVEKDARANAVSIGAPIDVTRSDDDFYPLWVANSYLGEHRTFNGVLMNQLRGVRGLNYGDYSYVENFVQEGGSTFPVPNIARREQYFSIWIRPVVPENTWFAVRAALYHLDKLESEGISEKDFQQTRKFLETYNKLWTQNASRRLGYAIDAKYYGKDIQKELERRLPSMTKADVDAAVRKHLPKGKFQIAVVTDHAEKFRSELLSGAPTPIHYDTKGTPEAVLAEDKTIEKFPVPVQADDVRVVPASDMFQR
jgi:zinc protease